MRKDVSNRIKSMLVIITMVIAALMTTTVSSTTVTNTGAVSSSPVPGATYVLVMDFTITENATDCLVDSDGSTTYLSGDVNTSPGTQLENIVDGDNLMYNCSYFEDNFALWIENGGGSHNWFNDTEDILLYNGTGGTPGPNIDNISDTNVSGSQLNSTIAITGGPGGNITGYCHYNDTNINGSYDEGEDIFWEPDNNKCFQESLANVTLDNTGTANDANITSLILWAEDGTSTGFQSNEDTNLGEITTLGDSISNIYDIINWTYPDDVWTPVSQRYYVTANLSGTAWGGETLKINASLNLNSTDGTTIINANTQMIGKLGVDYFEGTEEGAVDVITTDTKNLKYGVTTDIVVDTSQLINGSIYYLYRPYYMRTGLGGSYTYELQWKAVMTGGAEQVSVNGSKSSDTMRSISLDYAGMWVLDDDDPSDVNGTDDDFAYFWVNNSTPYTIEVSEDEVYYGKNETVTITVKENATTIGVWIDVFRDLGGRIFHTWEEDGTFSFNSDWLHNLTYAGNYTVKAYNDLDDTRIGYGIYGYSDDYGYSSPPITGTNYSGLCGPWDPFEKNATSKTLRVKTGEPDAAAIAGNDTMYWNFPGEVNISIKGYDGENLAGSDADLNVDVYNESGGKVTLDFINNPNHISDGYILISDNSWIQGDNGTWYAYIYKNKDSDSGAKEYTEEWNATVEWTVTSSPGLQFKWIDDDGVISDDNNDGVIPMVPDIDQQPLDIQFQLINNEHENYGDIDFTAAKKNITVSGDALFVGSLDKLPGVTYSESEGTWTVPLIPLMKLNGGEITISANWKGNGSVTETLIIGGTKLNGSIVTISPSEFVIDENVTLTVTVKGPTGYPYPNALVELYWVNDSGGLQGLIDSTTRGNTAGEYTFLFNKTQQTKNQTLEGNPWVDGDIKAPRNISAYVNLSYVGCGYALARMKPQSDLEVETSKGVVMAGEKTRFYVNVSIVDSTEQPVVDSNNPLQVAICNETGDRMTLDASFGSIRDPDLDDTNNSINDYFLKPGIYTLYAYNNTHDSVGNNATLIVKAVDIICDKEDFIWNFDKNISATFTVTYYGDPINGTLKLYNITDAGDYNKTWVNYSDDIVKNDTIELDIENGVITMYNITAEYLPSNKAQMDITFEFKPETSGAVFAKAMGIVPVKIPDVSASPASLPCNRLAMLDITTTGRGVGLANVWVSILIPGLTGEMNTTTDATGEATFVFTPPTTGNVIIKIENRTSSVKVPVTSWALYLAVPSQADEGVEFTLTVRNGTATGAGVAGAAVLFAGETKTTDSSGQATFTAPAVTAHREYIILATKEGYAEDTATILILNKPKLIIVAPSEADTGSAFDVVIADDAGSSVVGATVTLNEVTYTTGAQGIATLTAPSEKGDYAIAATFTGFTDADPVIIKILPGGIPGFELLTLIAAIGVAFILLRRRRN